MHPLLREALIWIGGALVFAALIGLLLALFLPEVDLLSLRYAVL